MRGQFIIAEQVIEELELRTIHMRYNNNWFTSLLMNAIRD